MNNFSDLRITSAIMPSARIATTTSSSGTTATRESTASGAAPVVVFAIRVFICGNSALKVSECIGELEHSILPQDVGQVIFYVVGSNDTGNTLVLIEHVKHGKPCFK